MEPNLKAISNSISLLHTSTNASLITSDDPNDLIFFNHTVNLPNPDEQDMEQSLPDTSDQSTSSAPTATSDGTIHLDKELAGLMLIDSNHIL